MAASQAKVVVLDDWNRLFTGVPEWSELAKDVPVDVAEPVDLGREELLALARDATIVVLNRERTTVDAAFIDELGSLELIVQTVSIGSNVDVDAATAKGVTVTAAPGLSSSIEGVAELAMGLLLGLARNIRANDQRTRTGEWAVPATPMLSGSTAGILGLGRLGGHIARACQCLGMSVLASGLTLTSERAQAAGAQAVEIGELFSRSDAVFLALRLSERSRGIVSREMLELMKPTAYFINVARGALVDEDALLDLLDRGAIAGAGLDTFITEPLGAQNRFSELDNVLLTPHIGWVTSQNATVIVRSVVDVIRDHFTSGG
jgi:phosphoglycerate dehydrogenase-like enzyme